MYQTDSQRESIFAKYGVNRGATKRWNDEEEEHQAMQEQEEAEAERAKEEERKMEEWMKLHMKGERFFERIGSSAFGEEVVHDYDDSGDYIRVAALPDIFEAFHQFRKQNEWKKVVEELPIPDKKLLVVLSNGSVEAGKFKQIFKNGRRENIGKQHWIVPGYSWEYLTSNVVKWQYFPES